MKKLVVILLSLMFGVGANSATPNDSTSAEQTVLKLTIDATAITNLATSAKDFSNFVKTFKNTNCTTSAPDDIKKICDDIKLDNTEKIKNLSNVNRDASTQTNTFTTIVGFYRELTDFQKASDDIDLLNKGIKSKARSKEFKDMVTTLAELAQKINEEADELGVKKPYSSTSISDLSGKLNADNADIRTINDALTKTKISGKISGIENNFQTPITLPNSKKIDDYTDEEWNKLISELQKTIGNETALTQKNIELLEKQKNKKKDEVIELRKKEAELLAQLDDGKPINIDDVNKQNKALNDRLSKLLTDKENKDLKNNNVADNISSYDNEITNLKKIIAELEAKNQAKEEKLKKDIEDLKKAFFDLKTEKNSQLDIIRKLDIFDPETIPSNVDGLNKDNNIAMNPLIKEALEKSTSADYDEKTDKYDTKNSLTEDQLDYEKIRNANNFKELKEIIDNETQKVLSVKEKLKANLKEKEDKLRDLNALLTCVDELDKTYGDPLKISNYYALLPRKNDAPNDDGYYSYLHSFRKATGLGSCNLLTIKYNGAFLEMPLYCSEYGSSKIRGYESGKDCNKYGIPVIVDEIKQCYNENQNKIKIMNATTVKEKLNICEHNKKELKKLLDACGTYVGTPDYEKILKKINQNPTNKGSYKSIGEIVDDCKQIGLKDSLEKTCSNGFISDDDKSAIASSLNIIRQARIKEGCCRDSKEETQRKIISKGFDYAYLLANRITVAPRSLQTIYLNKKYNCHNSTFLFEMLNNQSLQCSNSEITVTDIKPNLKCGKY